MELPINPIAIPVAAVAALVIGSIWYNPKIGFGNMWMRASGMTEEKMKSGHHAEDLKGKFNYPIIKDKRFTEDKFFFQMFELITIINVMCYRGKRTSHSDLGGQKVQD